MSLPSGTRLGPFEVTALLGTGGMGEVYRARDSKLNRDVAIKILPDEFAHDADRVARFTREAQTLASLNHPNIAQIFGVIEEDQPAHVHALVMELVEGDELSVLIARHAGSQDPAHPGSGVARGLQTPGMPLADVLPIAKQIADGLEAAHEQGIIHRDLKPANIKVRADGTVKILDFGLAKALDPAGASGSGEMMQSPTMTARATQMGMIIGTAAYMAPEQAKGKAVDRRADIWAFGVVLYEMLTGRRAFPGEDVSDVLASVLKSDPDWGAVPAGLPGSIRRLLRRCLEKDPRKRLSAIGDARLELDDQDVPSAHASSPLARPAARPASRGLVALLVLLAVALVTALGGLWRATRPVPPMLIKYDVAPVGGSTLGLVIRPAVGVSPDGSMLAFVASEADGATRLYLRRRDESEAHALVGTEGASGPVFSPDGRWVAFTASGQIKKTSLDGAVTPVVVSTDTVDGRGLTWLDDDTLVATMGTVTPLVRIPASGGTPTPLTKLDAAKGERSHRWPFALPGGKAVLFTVGTMASPDDYDGCAIDAVIVATGERKRVLDGARAAYYLAGGYLVFVRAATIFAVPFDPETMQTRGSPVPVLKGVAGDTTTGATHVSMSAEGTLVYVSGGLGSANRVVWASRETRANSQVEIPSGTYFDVRLSPDGSRAALSAVEGGSRNIWVHDFARTTFTKLSFADEGTAMSPVWSPDGKYIYYSWITNGGRLTTVMKRPADGSREAQAVVAVGDRVYLDYISRDETWAIVDKVHNATTADVVRISLLVKAPPTPIVSTRFDEYAGGVSPDGRWLAYQSDETGRYEVYVRGLSGDTGRWQVSTSGGEEPRWAPSGRELYFRRDATLLAVPVELAPTFKSGAAQPVVEGIYNFRSDTGISYDVDPKGGRFLMLRPAVDTKSPPGIRAIFNWPAEVERIVGRK